jgi:hypothetical protein
MKIKTLLIVSFLGLLGVILIVASIVFFASRRTERIADQSTQAQKLIERVFELNIFAQDYASRHEARPKIQWYSQYERLNEILSLPSLQETPSKEFYGRLRSATDDMKRSFDNLAAELDSNASNDAVENRLSSDLTVKTQRLLTVAHNLVEVATQERMLTRTHTDQLIFILLSVLALAAVALTAVFYRHLVVPIV